MNEYILLRGPRTDNSGNRIDIEIKIVEKTEDLDLSEYSYFQTGSKGIEEYVPTKELHLYQRANGIKNAFKN